MKTNPQYKLIKKLLPTADYPVSSKEVVFDAIVHERRVELAFEYHRFNDLKRWGLAPEVWVHWGINHPGTGTIHCHKPSWM